jgi:N-acetylneuraminic acid mutarotase
VEPGLSIRSKSAEIFDPVAKSWSLVADMPEARSGHTATLLSDGRVLVVGGTGGIEERPTIPGPELYDPVTNTWAPAASMARPRASHTATLLPSGRVLVAGGDAGGLRLADAELYDPVTNGWAPAGSMAEARNEHTATLLRDGTVLVAGGMVAGDSTQPGSYAHVAQVFDPTTNAWRAVPSMVSTRAYHTATLLPTGKVLVAGGLGPGPYPYGTYLASAEVYDPETSKWSPAASMITEAHAFHVATLLPSGAVLAISGQSVFDPVTNTHVPAGSESYW